MEKRSTEELFQKLSYGEVCRYYSQEYFKKEAFNAIEKSILDSLGEKSAKELRGLLENEAIIVNNIADFFKADKSADNLLITENYRDLTTFAMDTIFYIQKNISEGAHELELTQLFLNLALILESTDKNNESVCYFHKTLEQIILACLSPYNRTQIRFRMLTPKLLKKFQLQESTLKYYYTLWKILLYSLKKVSNNFSLVKVPQITVLYGIEKKIDVNFITQVSDAYDIPYREIEKILSRFSTTDFNLELKAFLKTVNQGKRTEEIKNLQERGIQKYKPEKNKLLEVLSKDVSLVYTVTNLFSEAPLWAHKYIYVDAKKIDIKYLEMILTYTAILTKLETSNKDEIFKVVVKNIEIDPTIRFVENTQKRIRNIQEIYGNNIFFEFQFNKLNLDNTTSPLINKVCIISDIHYDINKEHSVAIDTNNQFIINCGDTSGNLECTIDWIKKNMKYGVFTHGNHMGYSDRTPIEDQIQTLREEFPLDADVSYLHNQSKEYNGIIFIGSCLYTDFQLYGEERVRTNKQIALFSMNDFRKCRRRLPKLIRHVTPEDYVEWNKEAVHYISKTTLKFASKPIIVLTHFAPLPFSIHPKYAFNPLNSAFANDLRTLISSRPNIVMWCHGHCHDAFNYVYSQTRIVCEPYGYFSERTSAQIQKKYPQASFTFEDIKNRNLNNEIIKRYHFSDWDGHTITG